MILAAVFTTFPSQTQIGLVIPLLKVFNRLSFEMLAFLTQILSTLQAHFPRSPLGLALMYPFQSTLGALV